MESVAPPLTILLRVRQGLLMGFSLRHILRELCAEGLSGEFAGPLRRWWVAQDSGQPLPADFWHGQSIYRQAMVGLLEEGLKGASILEPLDDLEVEIRRAMEEELERFVATLPLRSLFPLVFFIFPALMLMVFGPLLLQLLESFR